MTQCNTKTRLYDQCELPVDIEFSAEDISSNGGAVLLGQAADRLDIVEEIAALVCDERDPDLTVHTRGEQVFQRAAQIALGYADQNDADWLKDDPILKTASGRLPEGEHLSSQPTLSRFENAVGLAEVEAMQWRLVLSWIEGLDDERTEVVLDFDSSAFEGHGNQQRLEFNGFHGSHILHPLLVFDARTGQLITVVARGGAASDAAGAVEWMRRIIVLLQTHHRHDCSVLVRADAGFAKPEVYRCLERLDDGFGQVTYVIGIARNSVLEEMLEPAMAQARGRRAATGRRSQVFVGFDYQAGSWEKARHIVGKAEVTLLGDNPRFVVTNLAEFSPRLVYKAGYCPRGNCERRIGEFKLGLEADRISCPDFEANGFRMILGAVAYRLLHELRRSIAEQADNTEDASVGKKLARLARATFQTLRLQLLKVAFVVRQSVRRIHLEGARSFPLADVFHQVARGMV